MQKENYEHSVNISKTGQNLSSLNAKVKSDRRKGVARMNANERRSEISKIMEVKRVSTAFELASVFGVSEKTIFRDVDIISLDIPLHKVPNVVGLDVEQAKKKLELFDIKYSGTGKKVVSQSPTKGEKIEEGATVRLMLE